MYNLENCVIPEDARLEKVFSHALYETSKYACATHICLLLRLIIYCQNYI